MCLLPAPPVRLIRPFHRAVPPPGRRTSILY
jgi:hypothetical protein